MPIQYIVHPCFSVREWKVILYRTCTIAYTDDITNISSQQIETLFSDNKIIVYCFLLNDGIHFYHKKNKTIGKSCCSTTLTVRVSDDQSGLELVFGVWRFAQWKLMKNANAHSFTHHS